VDKIFSIVDKSEALWKCGKIVENNSQVFHSEIPVTVWLRATFPLFHSPYYYYYIILYTI